LVDSNVAARLRRNLLQRRPIRPQILKLIRRRLRDLYECCFDTDKFVVISSPVRFIPDDIEGFGPASERCLVTFARKLRSARTGSDNLS
jgi:hypothetical protein